MPYVAVAVQAVVAWLIGYKLPLSITSKRYQKDGTLPVWPFWLCGFLGWVAMLLMFLFFAPSYSSRSIVTNSFIPGLRDLCWLLVFVFPIRACKRRADLCTANAPVPASDTPSLVDPLPKNPQDGQTNV